LSLMLVVVGLLEAGTYYVSTSGDDSWPGTSSSPWRHISYGVGKLGPGDTLVVLAGNYGDEQVNVNFGGRPDAPIVIRGEPPGSVTMEGRGGGTGFSITGSYIVVEGIRFRNYSSGVGIADPSSYVTVRRCIFEDNNSCGVIAWGTSYSIWDLHDILVEECQFYDHANTQDYGISFNYAAKVVARNNYFFGDHHQTLSFKRKVYYGLAKDNVFEGFLYTALYLGQNLDTSEEDNRSRYLIAEGNVFRPAEGHRAKRPIWVANVDWAVVRDNFMEGRDDVDGGWGEGIGLGDHEDGYLPANPDHVTIYRNVMRRIGGTTTNPGIRVYHRCGDVKVFNNTFANCAYSFGFEMEETILFLNNIFYNSRNGTVREGTGRNSIYEHNIFYPMWKGMGPTDISEDPLMVGPFDPLEVGGEDPKFVPDFTRAFACRLREGSPCIDAGRFLTWTVGSGSGTQVRVQDASFFTDGFGMAEGDIVKVGDEEPARVVGVDYDMNLITLDRPISWEDGEGVSMAYFGSAPDIGAYEYEPRPWVEEDAIDVVGPKVVVFPNPSCGRVFVECPVSSVGRVRIVVYDILGRTVRKLADDFVDSPGTYRTFWDGTDGDGRPTSPGVYVIRFEVGGLSSTRKLVRF